MCDIVHFCNAVAIKSKSIEVRSNFLAARSQGQAHSVNLDIENYSLWDSKKYMNLKTREDIDFENAKR